MNLKEAIRQLDAEADSIARERETLRVAAESDKLTIERLDLKVWDLQDLVRDLYRALEWENPQATQTFVERMEELL